MASSPIANFDSASAMLKALSQFLHGKDFPAIGQPQFLEKLVPAVNWLPKSGREWIYTVSGGNEATPMAKIANVKTEDLYSWAAGLYPESRHPCVFIGSSNGALVNLCAALGAPWLPQTFLIPVAQRDVSPDEPRAGLEAAYESANRFVEANPDIQLHQMHDPNQDRLMLNEMTYFRIKRRELGPAYRTFLDQRLDDNGTIVIVECRERWPVTKVADRYYFQFGAVGGMDSHEYFEGSDRISKHLAHYGSQRDRWDPPAPDTEGMGFGRSIRKRRGALRPRAQSTPRPARL